MPIFALAATGIPLAAAGDALDDAIALGVFCGLLVGKVVGIFGGARLAVRLRLGSLPGGVAWADVLPVATLGATGYTVSLLMTRLAIGDVAGRRNAPPRPCSPHRRWRRSAPSSCCAGARAAPSGPSRDHRLVRACGGADSRGHRPAGIPLGFQVVEDDGCR